MKFLNGLTMYLLNKSYICIAIIVLLASFYYYELPPSKFTLFNPGDPITLLFMRGKILPNYKSWYTFYNFTRVSGSVKLFKAWEKSHHTWLVVVVKKGRDSLIFTVATQSYIVFFFTTFHGVRELVGDGKDVLLSKFLELNFDLL